MEISEIKQYVDCPCNSPSMLCGPCRKAKAHLEARPYEYDKQESPKPHCERCTFRRDLEAKGDCYCANAWGTKGARCVMCVDRNAHGPKCERCNFDDFMAVNAHCERCNVDAFMAVNAHQEGAPVDMDSIYPSWRDCPCADSWGRCTRCVETEAHTVIRDGELYCFNCIGRAEAANAKPRVLDKTYEVVVVRMTAVGVLKHGRDIEGVARTMRQNLPNQLSLAGVEGGLSEIHISIMSDDDDESEEGI